MSNCPNCCDAFRQRQRLQTQIAVLTERVNRHVELPNYCFGNPVLSDFRIQAGDKTFYVTKYQLALKSRVFAKMFDVDMDEKKEGVMKLDDSPDVVEAMLKYMYMYKKVEGKDLARKVIQLAYRFEIDELKDQCELEIIKKLTTEDAEHNLMFSLHRKLSTLYWKCSEVLLGNFNGLDHDITLDSNDICFHASGSADSPIATNHSNTKIACKIYAYTTDGSLRPCMEFQVIGPMEELVINGNKLNGCENMTGVVYYAPYIPGFTDYDHLHLLSSARFFTVYFKPTF